MWTGQTLFDPNTITMFNVLFTLLPPFTLGLFDRFEDQNTRMKNPSLYCFSQNGLGYNAPVFWRWICQAILHSVILFWLPMLAMDTSVNSWGGQSEGRIDLGNTVYTCVVVTVIVKALIEKDCLTGVCIVFLSVSVFLWFLVLSLYSYFWLVTGLTSPTMLDSIYILSTNTGFWFCLVTAPTLCVSLDLLYRSLERMVARYQDTAGGKQEY